MSSNADAYVFAKSMMNNVSDNKYKSKEWVYVNDNSNGNYSSGQVVFDTSTLANSSTYCSWEEAFITLPLIATLHQDNADGLDRSDFALVMKAVNAGLITSITINQNGKTMVSQTPKLHLYNSFNAYVNNGQESQVTKEHLGLLPDDSKSWAYNTTYVRPYATVKQTLGNGFCNNANLNENEAFSVVQPNINLGTMSNMGGLKRSRSTNTGIPSTFTLMNESDLQRELRPYTRFAGTAIAPDTTVARGTTNYQAWYWSPVIRLKDISNLFEGLGLVKGAYFQMTINLNLGSCVVRYLNTAGGNSVISSFLGESTFLNYCPVQVNTNELNFQTNTTGRLCVVSLFCGTVLSSISSVTPNTSSLGIPNHPLQQCRLYVPQVVLSPDYELQLVDKYRDLKKLEFDDIFQTQIYNIASGASFSYNVSNAQKGAYALVIVPAISSLVNGLAIGAFPTVLNAGAVAGDITRASSVWLSPFAGNSPNPMSIGSFQVNINGKSLFPNFLNYTVENFLEQLNAWKSLNGNVSDGLETSLISKSDWESLYRYYMACWPLESANDIQSITISGINNTRVACDYEIYVMCRRTAKVNILTGFVSETNF